MDKGRAIIIRTMTLRRYREGSPELLDTKHLFYEAEREIEKNGWETEAQEHFKKDKEERIELFRPVSDSLYEILKSETVDIELEEKYSKDLQKFSVDGELEEIAKYRALNNGSYPDSKTLRDLLSKRRDEDEKIMRAFLNDQVKIYNCESVDCTTLYSSVRHLKSRGLYKLALANIPLAIQHSLGKKLGFNEKDFEPFMYP